MEDRPADDASLLAKAKRGELRAYEEVVEQHQATAFRVAWLITGSSADAEEAAQDAFLKAYRIARTRLAANTLLVQHGPIMVRIEGKFGLGRAKAIARSLRSS